MTCGRCGFELEVYCPRCSDALTDIHREFAAQVTRLKDERALHEEFSSASAQLIRGLTEEVVELRKSNKALKRDAEHSKEASRLAQEARWQAEERASALRDQLAELGVSPMPRHPEGAEP